MSIDGYTGSAITTHQGNPSRGKTCKQVVWCAHVSVLQVEGPGVTKMKRKMRPLSLALEKTKSLTLQVEGCSYLSALPIALTFVPFRFLLWLGAGLSNTCRKRKNKTPVIEALHSEKPWPSPWAPKSMNNELFYQSGKFTLSSFHC